LEIKTYAPDMSAVSQFRACDYPVCFSPELRALYEPGKRLSQKGEYILRNPRFWGDRHWQRIGWSTSTILLRVMPAGHKRCRTVPAARNGEPASGI